MKVQEFTETTKFIAFQWTGENLEEVQEFLKETEEKSTFVIPYEARLYAPQELILIPTDIIFPTLFARPTDHIVISQHGEVDTYSDHRLKNCLKHQK